MNYQFFLAGTLKNIPASTREEFKRLEFSQLRTFSCKQGIDAGVVLRPIAFKILIGRDRQDLCASNRTLEDVCNPILLWPSCPNYVTTQLGSLKLRHFREVCDNLPSQYLVDHEYRSRLVRQCSLSSPLLRRGVIGRCIRER
jgi:hypothetical protein